MCPCKDPEARRAYHRQYYAEHKEIWTEYQQSHKTEIRNQRRKWYQKNKDTWLPKQSKYSLRSYYKHRDKRLKRRREMRLRERQKFLAREKAKDSVPLGPKCEICGSTENLERHHPDYSKPLEIITLCRRCHRAKHSKYS